MHLWNFIETPVTPKYLFLAFRDDGDNFLLQHLHNTSVDFKIVRQFEQKHLHLTNNAVWGHFPCRFILFGINLLASDNVKDCVDSKLRLTPLGLTTLQSIYEFMRHYCQSYVSTFAKQSK